VSVDKNDMNSDESSEESTSGSLTSAGLRRSLRVLMMVIAKWNVLIGRTAILIAVLGAAAALVLPDVYTATVVILPPQQSSSGGAALLAQLGSLGGMAAGGAGAMGIKNPNDLQIALLKSETVQNAIIHRFHLDQLYGCKYLSKSRRQWERRTHVDGGVKDGLIRLSVEDKDPARAALLANGWVDEYRRFGATLAVSEAAQRRLFFEQQLASARDELASAEDALKQTELRTGVIEIGGQAHAMIESAAVLRGQIAAKQVEIRGMHQFAAEQNPDLVRAEQELAGLTGQLAQMDVQSNGRRGDLVAPKGSLTDAGLAYVRAQREVKYHETVYELLARQYEVARVDEARQGASIQVVDAAEAPDRPSSAYRWWTLTASLLFAFPLSILIALGAEATMILRLRRRRSGSWIAAFHEQWSEAAQ